MGMNNAANSIKNSGLLKVGALGAVTAAVVNSVIFGIGKAADVPFVVTDGGTEEAITVGMVIFMSLASFLVGLAGVTLAHRFLGRRSLRPFAVLGIVLALASNISFPGVEASVGSKWLLATMHLVVGVAYVATLEIVRSRTADHTDTAVGPGDTETAVTAATT